MIINYNPALKPQICYLRVTEQMDTSTLTKRNDNDFSPDEQQTCCIILDYF